MDAVAVENDEQTAKEPGNAGGKILGGKITVTTTNPTKPGLICPDGFTLKKRNVEKFNLFRKLHL